MKLMGGSKAQLLFTAPHAVNHLREGVLKCADRWTGGLAEALTIALGSRALAPDGRVNGDPNWNVKACPFKQKLHSLLCPDTVVIDLHGMKNDYGIGINIGMGSSPDSCSKTLVERLVRSFEKLGQRPSINWPFGGFGRGTITSFVQSLGHSALQIEIAANLRQPCELPIKAILLMQGFINALHL
ncbi:MAG TPA: hypothetical protein VKU37_08210 [Verrucomicrobiae bacterium]|nr:hypothetical protein [Verrucomicrobiae bacterium]